MDDNEKAEYSGKLLHWQKLYETALHSDGIAAEFHVKPAVVSLGELEQEVSIGVEL